VRQQKPVNSPGVVVFMAMSSTELFGPFYFERTVNHDTYQYVLENQLLPEIRARGLDPKDMTFQQDGAPPHRYGAVINYLQRNFGSLIALNTDFEWPPRSPDLTPLDFYLWGVLKYKVYQHPTRTIAELKQRIEEAVQEITEEVNLHSDQ
jgi:hypothetical protein